MPTGTIARLLIDKGFGFIAPGEGGNDVFVHVSELERTGLSDLNPGEKVTFDVEPDQKSGKPRAVNVHLAE